MNLGRAWKEKDLSIEYVTHTNSFFEQYWSLDFWNLRRNEFFSQLKPKLQKEVSDIWFKWVYDKFCGYFRDLEHGFRREVVHNLEFQEVRICPPYTDKYIDDKRSLINKQKNVLLNK